MEDIIIPLGLKYVAIFIFLGDAFYFLNFFVAQEKKGVIEVWK